MFNFLEKMRQRLLWWKHRGNIKIKWRNNSLYWNIFCTWKNITIWNNCTFNEWVLLNWDWELIIWNFCRISAYSQIHSWWLNLEQDYKERGHIYKKTELKNWVWIWAWSIILPWVTIWEWSVIWAWSVVTKDIPSKELWFWNPAKFYKKI